MTFRSAVNLFSVCLVLSIAAFSASVYAAETPDYAQLYKQYSPSVVTVHTISRPSTSASAQRQRGLGSGVLISETEILTAAHVVDEAEVIEVRFKDDVTIPAVVVASLDASDVALLKLQQRHPDPTIAMLANSDKTPIGSPVFVIGSPFGISQTLSVGHLSGRLNRGAMAGGAPIEFLQTDTAINTGNSGGPMFNKAGEVIGIVSFIMSKSGGFDGIGFATSSNTLQQALLSSSGILAGFEGILLSEPIAAALNLSQTGLLVQRVVAGSIAERAGLRAGNIPSTIDGQPMLLGGDVILEINGLVCAAPHDFELVQASTLALDEGDTYAILVQRDGVKTELIAGQPLGDQPLSK